MTRSFPLSYSEECISCHCDDLSVTESYSDISTPHKLADPEESLLANNGYLNHKTLTKTLQGELLTAQLYDDDNKKYKYVVLKKTSKRLYSRREAKDNGFNFIVDEDIVQESAILRHLTLFNKAIGDAIVQYIDFFESDTHFYLVTEYIESNMNLKQFVIKCHAYLQNNQLKWKDYLQIIKYIVWQLIATIYWLHNDMKCCVLDFCPENIMLSNLAFVENPMDNTVYINPKIGIKLVDFGASEIFNGNLADFKCNKQYISLENEQYLAPNISKQAYYNASAADMWSLGMIIYFCFFGDYPFKTIQETDSNQPLFGTPYWFICNNKFMSYIQRNSLLPSIPHKALSLITGLLNIDEKKRFKCMDVLQHSWLYTYYKRYSSQIERKSILQKRQLLQQQLY